jgi:hypothetical protein
LRHELAADGDPDVTVSPATSGNASSEPGTSEAGSQTGQSTGDMQSSITPRVSNAEYIVSRFTEHKSGVVIALLVLVGAAVGFGVYLNARNTRSAIPSVLT